nr:hypothetical protein [Tanacetum cinerariifolium]
GNPLRLLPQGRMFESQLSVGYEDVWRLPVAAGQSQINACQV